MYLYECILTLDIEIKYFWTGNITGATMLYLLNKYIYMYYAIYGIATISNSSYPQVVIFGTNWIRGDVGTSAGKLCGRGIHGETYGLQSLKRSLGCVKRS